MLQLHDRTDTATAIVVVDRLDRLPGGRAVTLLTADGQLILPFDKHELTAAGAVQLQALLQRAVAEGVIALTISQGPAVAGPQRHAS